MSDDDDRKRVAGLRSILARAPLYGSARDWDDDLRALVRALAYTEAERDVAREDLASAEHDLARLIAVVRDVERGTACTGDVHNIADSVEANGRERRGGAMTCTTHHNACDCREAAHAAEVARLTAIVAAADALRDAVIELDNGLHRCRLCRWSWDRRDVPSHRPDCVALAYDLARGER